MLKFVDRSSPLLLRISSFRFSGDWGESCNPSSSFRSRFRGGDSSSFRRPGGTLKSPLFVSRVDFVRLWVCFGGTGSAIDVDVCVSIGIFHAQTVFHIPAACGGATYKFDRRCVCPGCFSVVGSFLADHFPRVIFPTRICGNLCQ